MNIGIIVLIGAVVWALSLGRTANRLGVIAGIPQNVRINLGAIEWNQPFRINNPTPTPISFQAIDIDVQYRGIVLGRGNLISNTSLKPGDTNVVVRVALDNAAVLRALPNIALGLINAKLDFVGSVKAYGVNFPVKTSYAVNLPRLI